MFKLVLHTKQAAALFMVILAACFFSCKKETELPDVVSFSSHIVPIFNAHCNSTGGCHTGGSPAGNLNLNANVAYAQLFTNHEVDTLNPTTSVLYIEVNSGSMPKNAGHLSDYDVGVILKWIQQKAKNN